MSSRGERTIDHGILACHAKPCPPAKIGDRIRIRLNAVRAQALGFSGGEATVVEVSPVLHGYLIHTAVGDVIVGGHGSSDAIEVIR